MNRFASFVFACTHDGRNGCVLLCFEGWVRETRAVSCRLWHFAATNALFTGCIGLIDLFFLAFLGAFSSKHIGVGRTTKVDCTGVQSHCESFVGTWRVFHPHCG